MTKPQTFKRPLMACLVAAIFMVACAEVKDEPAIRNAPTGKHASSGPNDSLSAYLNILTVDAGVFRSLPTRGLKLAFRYTILGKKLGFEAYKFTANPNKPDSVALFTAAPDTVSEVYLKDGNDLTSLVIKRNEVKAIRDLLIANASFSLVLFVPKPNAEVGGDGYKWHIFIAKRKDSSLIGEKRFLELRDTYQSLNPTPPRDYGGL